MVERKVFFISKTGSLGEKVDSCPEANSPLRVSEQELIKGVSGCVGYRQEGALCRNSTVSSDSHLETGCAVV